MEQLPKPQQNIPASITKTAQLLEKLSYKLATEFAYKLFVTPIRHKTPAREEKMEKQSVQKSVYIPEIKRNICVYEYGQSERKVLLVHGWSGRGTQLISIADALLKQGYMTISFDGPAHGKSEGKTAHMDMFVRSILELEKQYGKFEIVIGHSLGGMSVMNSLKRGLQSDKAIIIGAGDILIDIFQGFVKTLKLKPIIAEKLKDKVEKKLNSRLVDYDVFRAAQVVNIPVFVIHDKHDKDVPYVCGEHIYKHLPSGKLLLTEGLGHRRILGDKEVIKEIINFIQ